MTSGLSVAKVHGFFIGSFVFLLTRPKKHPSKFTLAMFLESRMALTFGNFQYEQFLGHSMTTVVVGDSQCLTSEMKLFQSLSNSATCCRIFSCPSLLFLLTEFHCVPPVHGIEAKMVVGTALYMVHRFFAYSKPSADVPSISAVMRVVTQ